MVSKWLNKQFPIRGSDGPSLGSLFGWKALSRWDPRGPGRLVLLPTRLTAEARTEVILFINMGVYSVKWVTTGVPGRQLGPAGTT